MFQQHGRLDIAEERSLPCAFATVVGFAVGVTNMLVTAVHLLHR